MAKARILCYMTPPTMKKCLIWELSTMDIDKLTLICPSQGDKPDDEANIL